MSDATPSWVTPPRSTPASKPERLRVPLPLLAALVATTILAGAQAVHVARRDELVVGLRVFLVAVVVFQVVLAAGAARRSAGAALGLLLCQLTTGLASMGGGFGDQRALFAGGALLVFVLVAASLSAFPSVALPPIDPGSP
jgi:hypothetical protein